MATPEEEEEMKQLLREVMAANKPKPSMAESAVRGAAQGATSGFGDELGAAIDTGVSKIPGVRNIAQMLHDDKLPRIDDPSIPYDKRRDAYRGNNAAAATANPGSYVAGEIGGGIAQMALPPVKALNAAGPVGRVVGNAVLGGAGGAGFSDKSGSALAKDAIKGAGVGATVGALSTVAGTGGKAAGGARAAAEEAAVNSNAKPVAGAGSAERQAEREFQRIGQKADVKAQQRLEQMGPDYIFGVAKKHGLTGAHDPRIPGAAAERKVGAAIGDAYKAIDAAGVKNAPSMNSPATTSTVSPAAIGDALGAMEAKLAKRFATQPMAAEVAKVREGLIKKYPNGIPLSDLNAEIGAIQAEGYAGSLLAPSVGAKLKRTTAHALDEVMENALATIKKERPGAAAAIDALPGLNKEYSALKTINGVYSKRIPKERFAPPEETTLRQAVTAPIKSAGTMADELIAKGLRKIPGGQAGARAAATGARALSPAIIDHLNGGNTKAAIDQMGQEVYGE